MKARWYNKIDVTKFSLSAGQTTMRRNTQRQVYSALRAEPAVAASVLKSSMPESTMNRLAAERMAKQGYVRGQMMSKSGFAGQDDPAYGNAADLIKKRNGEPTKDDRSTLTKIGDAVTGAGEGIVSGLGTGLTWLGNLVDTPYAAGAGSGDTYT
ncbi:MAG: hypothetical protein ACRDSH_07090, partial [Pseudonocardiaceae bacterium]